MRDGARERHQVLVARLRARGQSRHGDGGGHEQAESEREQEEALRGHWATSVPDRHRTTTEAVASTTWHPGGASPCWSSRWRWSERPRSPSPRSASARAAHRRKGSRRRFRSARCRPTCATQIEAGFRQGRSPDVMATTACRRQALGRRRRRLASVAVRARGERRPDRLLGARRQPRPRSRMGRGSIGSRRRSRAILGFDRPHPEVRSGAALAEAVHADARPPLVVEVVWKGVGTAGARPGADVPGWAATTCHGAWTFDGDDGLAAARPGRRSLTTIGTGGLPSQHGITASVIRDARRAIRSPRGAQRAPTSIVATLGDDWDHTTAERRPDRTGRARARRPRAGRRDLVS